MKNILLAFILLFSASLSYGQATTTPNLQLQLPAYQQPNWQVPLDYDLTLIDAVLAGAQALPTGTTPTISQYANWITANGSPTTITNFVNGLPGATLHILCGSGDTYTTISESANIAVNGTWTCASSLSISLVLNGSVWIELGRAGGGSGGSGGIPYVSSLPAFCTPGVTSTVQLSVSPYTVNYCSATNTWTALGSGGGGGSWATISGGTATSQNFIVGNSASFSASGGGTITATSTPFSGLTGGTVAGSSMYVGNSSVLAANGTGIITATNVPWSGVTGAPVFATYPSAGVPISTGSAWGTSLTPAPASALVGISDAQTLTNKSIDGSEVNSGTVSPTYGGTGASAPVAHSFAVSEGALAYNFPPPPTGIGQWYCFYNIVVTGAIDPACAQAGLGNRAIIGSSSTDLVVFSDNGAIVEHDAAATSAVNESLPTPTTLSNPEFAYSYSNHTVNYTDTITPVSPYTINGNASLSVPQSAFCRISIDPNSLVNWLADCANSIGGSSSTPYVILTPAATISWAVSGPTSNAQVTLNRNSSLSISGAYNGWKGSLFVIQPASGGPYTLSLPSGFYVQGGGAGAITLSTAANAIDEINIALNQTKYFVKSPYLNYTASGGGAPTFALVETVTGYSGSACSTGVTATLGTATGAGELMVLEYWGGSSGAAMTITDSASESYTKAYERTSIAAHYTSGLAYFLTTASGVTTVTVSGGSNTYCGLVVQHWTRSTGSWAVDQTAAASATAQSSPWSSPTFTTTSANEILIGAAFANHGSGSTCSIAATGSWTGHASSSDGNGNISMLSNQTVTSIQTGIANTGTTGTCTPAGTYPGAVSFK